MSDSYVAVSGFNGDITISGGSAMTQHFPMVSWSARLPATILTYTNSMCGNHPNRIATFTDADVTAVLDYSEATQPFQPSIAIIPGLIVGPVNCIVSSAAEDLFTFTNMVVADMPVTLERAGKVMLQIHLQFASGTITLPGGIVY